MMEDRHEGGTKHEATVEGTAMGSGLPSEAKHDNNKPTTENLVSGLEAVAAKHEANVEGKKRGSSSSSSASSSSSSSSLQNSKLNSGEVDPLDDSCIKPDLPLSPSSECASPPDVSIQTPQWSMVSASPRAGPGNSFSRELLPPNPDWSISSSSPIRSPLPQTMGRQTGYDPARIPSSIFSAKPTTPMEWSVASNESLFSIHMGNSSFSRDYILSMGDGKQDDPSLYMQNASETKTEPNTFTTNLPPVLEAASENDKKNVDIKEESVAEGEPQKPPKINPGETVQQHEKQTLADGAREANLVPTSSTLSAGNVSAPRVSNESGTSSGSFVFPVLDTNDGGKCASLNTIAEKPEETQSQNQGSQPPPKATQTGWFSCFSCWPKCC